MSQHVSWVFCDRADLYPELLAGAIQAGGEVRAFVLGGDAEAKRAFSHGAHKVYLLERDESRMVEDLVPTMAAAIGQDGPAVVLLGATRRGKAMAARLGMALGAAVVNEITALSPGDPLRVSRMAYGGLAVGEVEIRTPIAVFTAGPGVFTAAEVGGGVGETVRLPRVQTPPRITCLERRPREVSSVNLASAKRVVSVGRGLKAREDLALARDLAAVLGAELGCSRPVAEGAGWLEMERYIGVTGVKLKADIYLALGISGQIQHLVGVSGVRTVFAVNRDKNAPIFRSADYGLVGDIYKVVPALTALLRGGARNDG